MAPNVCPECGANFDTDTELLTHRKLSHPGAPKVGGADAPPEDRHPDLEQEMEWEGGPSPNRLSEDEDTRREARESTSWNPDESDLQSEPERPPRREPRSGEH